MAGTSVQVRIRSVIPDQSLGLDHLLDLTLQARGEFRRVIQLEEILAPGFVERRLPDAPTGLC